MKRLNLRPAGGNFLSLRKHAIRLGCSIEHFRVSPPIRPKIEDLSLLKRGTRIKGKILKRLVVKAGLNDKRCVECGNGTTHNGKPLTLQLDHSDGDSTNNEIVNLRFLCPNCHTQTPTYARRKTPREKSVSTFTLTLEKCGGCGNDFMMKPVRKRHLMKRGRSKFFCSRNCGVKFVPIEVLIEKYGELGSYSAVGKLLGISDVAVRKRIIRESSKGRTAPFEGDKDGSSPSSRTS